jgi:phosphoserine phosphatase
MENEKSKKIALIYDFDGTLAGKCMQEYYLFPHIMGVDGNDFWTQKQEMQKTKIMDPVLAYLYLIFKKSKEKNIKITRELLNTAGQNIEYFPGVETWFERINKYGQEKNIIVEHYIISSGIKEILEGTTIAKYFKQIFACEFHYNEEDEVDWLSCAVNFTNKTQFIFRINKGNFDIYDERGVNKYIPHAERTIPFENMIYIGDGETDIPCMKIVKAKGGKSVAVYENENKISMAKELLELGRISFFAKADYSEGSTLEIEIKKIIDEVN